MQKWAWRVRPVEPARVGEFEWIKGRPSIAFRLDPTATIISMPTASNFSSSVRTTWWQPFGLIRRAILYTSDHQPFSEVNERYQERLLAFLRGR